MNKKNQYKLLLLILVIIVIINLAIILTANDNITTNNYNTTTVGKNANGTVYKIVAGNSSSNETVGIILGVHPREHEIHEAVNRTIHNITCENGDQNLTKKYVIYYVKVKDELTSRDDPKNLLFRRLKRINLSLLLMFMKSTQFTNIQISYLFFPIELTK